MSNPDQTERAQLEDFLQKSGWEVHAEVPVPGREAVYAELEGPSISGYTKAFSKRIHPAGLYRHQQKAVELFCEGHDVCLSTGTASGKTTLFQCAALEVLARDHNAKILALYPLRALTAEQEDRWRRALAQGIRNASVARIDGGVPVASRAQRLANCQVIVATPDILHAWLLPNVGDRRVRKFLANLQLVVLDEAHEYKGVFGSNAALLLRRLRHLAEVLGASPSFVSASATIASPAEHLKLITGRNFTIVGEEDNGAKVQDRRILFLNPPADVDLPSAIPTLLRQLGRIGQTFIAFLDSRKQVELYTSIAARHEERDEEPDEGSRGNTAEAPDWVDQFDHLAKLSILPYRSGYEEDDRRRIQARLSDGTLKGIVSTSALELGIDIAGLDVAVLVGAPATSTSLLQRIGRVGRHRPGLVLIVNTGTIYDEVVFADPPSILRRPPAEGALYLENKRIQYIHSMCLARLGGEHDQAVGTNASDIGGRITSSVEWPSGFMEAVEAERSGQITGEFQAMKSEAGDTPHFVFPLRDVEQQFKITLKQGPESVPLGTVSFSQCLREAYPGAIYRYLGRPYRIFKVSLRSREIQARRERGFITKPNFLPTLVFPNLAAGNVYSHLICDDLHVIECALQVREWINGFTEIRGPSVSRFDYPQFAVNAGIFYDQPFFARNYFTSGVILQHPCLNSPGVKCDEIARLLLDALVLAIPFERNDVSAAYDKMRRAGEHVSEGSRFLAVYDSTYGSLRLSGRLATADNLPSVLKIFGETVQTSDLDDVSREAGMIIAGCGTSPITERADAGHGSESTREGLLWVVAPGSVGALINRDCEEFQVNEVYWNPRANCVFYKGRPQSIIDPDTYAREPYEYVLEIPGVSRMVLYDPETNEVVNDGV